MRGTEVFTATQTFETEDCYKCGVVFAMTEDFRQRRLRDRKEFYCPNGHGQHYLRESEGQKIQHLEARLASAGEARDHYKRSRDTMRGVVTKMKKRIGKGSCPCCKRHFTNVERHMKSQHPDYAEGVTQ
jgi:hypothetical protein